MERTIPPVIPSLDSSSCRACNMKHGTRSHRSSRSDRRCPAVLPSSGSDGFSTTNQASLTSNTSLSDTPIDPGHSLFRSQPHSASPRPPSLPYRHPVLDVSSVGMALGIWSQPEQHHGLYATQSQKATDHGSPDSEDDSATSMIVSRHSPASSPLPQWPSVLEESKKKAKKKKHGKQKRKRNHETDPGTAPDAGPMYDRTRLPSTPHVQMGGPPTYEDHQADEFEYQTPAPTPPTYDPSDLNHVGASWPPIVFPYPSDLPDADFKDIVD
ncbi:uncharacterized protein B0T15DRAFT_57191 [Chaetomium strumarium]|uniref:Uncharacterized protein n=1 Tax=Chaetomium strumarium TaxID=1170767 RepID=A0AAJ0H360_9PEZI|nr:hypothetical protein B0T15DRAFT_57191 [Chaetomium strumarium]